jgi:hypothetical protein
MQPFRVASPVRLVTAGVVTAGTTVETITESQLLMVGIEGDL